MFAAARGRLAHRAHGRAPSSGAPAASDPRPARAGAAEGGAEGAAPAPSVRLRHGRSRRQSVAAALTATAAVAVAALLLAAPRGVRPAAARPAGLLGTTAKWSVVSELSGRSSSGRPAPLELASIACTATPGSCVAVGGQYVARRAGNGRWSVGPAPAGAGFLTSVACAGAGHCVAVAQPSGGPAGSLVITTADGGATWRVRNVPASVGGLSAVACATPSRCTAVGESRGEAVTVTTVDGGTTWDASPVPAAVAGLDAIGCAAGPRGTCVAAGWLAGSPGAAIAVLPSGGGSRSPEAAPRGVAALSTVDCPSSSVCYAGGFLTPGRATAGARQRFPGAVAVTTDGGRQWHLLALPALAGPVNSLSCTSVSACVAVGVSALAGGAHPAAGPPGMALSTVDGGRHWQVDSLPADASGLAGVSCVAGAVAPNCTATAAGPASSSLVLEGVS